MPGHLQEGFGCVVTNRFDQLFDDESDPFEVLRAAESRRKESSSGGGSQGGGGGGPRGGQAAQANFSSGGAGSGGGGGSGQAGAGGGSGNSSAAKQLRRETQKERKAPLPPFAAASSAGGAGDRRDDGSGQPAAPLRKEGIRRIGRRPDQQQPQGEGKPIDRRQERRPPRERRFDKPAEEKGEGGEFSVDKPITDRPMRGRGGPGGRGGRGGRGRGMGRGDGFDSRGKREFDRHSGSDRSGLKHEDKRGGSGSHNWGTVKDELTDLDQSNVTEETPEGEEHPPADSENKENEVEEVKEEGPKEMTLDEWKAIQNKDRAKVEFNIRKPNEGADGQWKKGFVLHKSKSEETKGVTEMQGTQLEANETHAEDSVIDHHFRKPANDITSQLEINFGDLGRPGRGGRGSRGGRGRGGRAARGSRTDKLVKEFDVIHTPSQSSASAPDVDDPEAFPALS